MSHPENDRIYDDAKDWYVHQDADSEWQQQQLEEMQKADIEDLQKIAAQGIA
jgi:hypothetical protein